MAAQTEPQRIGDVIIEEVLETSAYCRGPLTTKDGEVFVLGALGEASAGKQIVCTTGANCNGICLRAESPSGADGSTLFAIRGPMVVNYNAISFGALDAAGKTAAIAALLALNIVVRDTIEEDTL